MDACNYLSKRKNYDGLVRKAMAVIKGHSPEDAYDIVAEALVFQLKKFRESPESLFEVEKKGEDDMRRFLERCVKNRVYSLLEQKNRKQIKIVRSLSEVSEEEENRNIFNFKSIWNDSIKIFRKLKKRFGTVKVDIDEFTIGEFKKDISLFFDAKFGSETRKLKEEAIDLYIERFQKNFSIPQLQEIYPKKNVASLNSEACRLIKTYLNWLKTKGKSSLFKFEDIERREY